MSRTSDYVVTIDGPKKSTRCECGGGCGWTGRFSSLHDIDECVLTPGDGSPAGRCPKCESLAYPVKPIFPNKEIDALVRAAIKDGRNSDCLEWTRRSVNRVADQIQIMGAEFWSREIGRAARQNYLLANPKELMPKATVLLAAAIELAEYYEAHVREIDALAAADAEKSEG